MALALDPAVVSAALMRALRDDALIQSTWAKTNAWSRSVPTLKGRFEIRDGREITFRPIDGTKIMSYAGSLQDQDEKGSLWFPQIKPLS